MTLTGTGFGSTIADNRVVIGGETCEIKSATDTQIVCKAPEKSSDTTTAAILYVGGVLSPNLCQCASGVLVRMCLYPHSSCCIRNGPIECMKPFQAMSSYKLSFTGTSSSRGPTSTCH